MGMSFCTGYIEKGEVQRNLRQVAKCYMKTWFIFDTSVLVVEWFGILFDLGSSVSHGQSALRSSRLLRISRMVRVVRLIKLTRAMGKLESVTTNLRIQIIFAILKLSCTLFFIVHLLACGWYAVGSLNEEDGWIRGGKLGEPGSIESQDTITKYVASVRWTLAQIHGRTDQEPRPMLEMLYIAMCAVFAIMFMSYFVGSMTTRLMEMQKLIARDGSYLQVLQTYNDSHHLSMDTVRMCKSYMKDQLSFQTAYDAEGTLLELLPRQAQADLLFEVRATCIGSHPFWSILVDKYSHAIRIMVVQATCLNMTRCLETVFERGALLDQMLFVDDGNLVYSRQATLKAVLLQRFRTEEERSARLKHQLMRVSQVLCHCRKHRMKTKIFSGTGTEIRQSSWLSEAALWTKSWAARGDLMSQTYSRLISINAQEMVIALHGYDELLHITSYYARCFVLHLRDLIHIREDSDIVHVHLYELFGFAENAAENTADDADKEDIPSFDVNVVPVAADVPQGFRVNDDATEASNISL
eukprot:TRINITY_DN7288_c0_g1_i3.p1 TRINITY_DN7288_c0_g1~~TRINITY_DN7288_c0_g1_i3.p1  ORF type:complete len:588 (+),score=77.80 TRINITY_DN7288_c0_g1_i3:190-1764(+)